MKGKQNKSWKNDRNEHRNKHMLSTSNLLFHYFFQWMGGRGSKRKSQIKTPMFWGRRNIRTCAHQGHVPPLQYSFFFSQTLNQVAPSILILLLHSLYIMFPSSKHNTFLKTYVGNSRVCRIMRSCLLIIFIALFSNEAILFLFRFFSSKLQKVPSAKYGKVH